MQLKVLDLYESLLLLLLHLLIGLCSVFYPVCLFFCDIHVQLSQQRFGDHPGGLEMFGSHFLRFLQAGYHLSCLHGLFPCSSPDSDPSYDTLNLIDVLRVSSLHFYLAGVFAQRRERIERASS